MKCDQCNTNVSYDEIVSYELDFSDNPINAICIDCINNNKGANVFTTKELATIKSSVSITKVTNESLIKVYKNAKIDPEHTPTLDAEIKRCLDQIDSINNIINKINSELKGVINE